MSEFYWKLIDRINIVTNLYFPNFSIEKKNQREKHSNYNFLKYILMYRLTKKFVIKFCVYQIIIQISAVICYHFNVKMIRLRMSF